MRSAAVTHVIAVGAFASGCGKGLSPIADAMTGSPDALPLMLVLMDHRLILSVNSCRSYGAAPRADLAGSPPCLRFEINWRDSLMVRIDRVVTRGGDAGQTSLGNGERVGKTLRASRRSV
jgi:hypothetical protein